MAMSNLNDIVKNFWRATIELRHVAYALENLKLRKERKERWQKKQNQS